MITTNAVEAKEQELLKKISKAENDLSAEQTSIPVNVGKHKSGKGFQAILDNEMALIKENK